MIKRVVVDGMFPRLKDKFGMTVYDRFWAYYLDESKIEEEMLKLKTKHDSGYGGKIGHNFKYYIMENLELDYSI